jgi:hypothetical protein
LSILKPAVAPAKSAWQFASLRARSLAGVPINDQLLDPDAQRSDSQTEDLLTQWAPRHWVRSIANGLSFVVYLWASVSS